MRTWGEIVNMIYKRNETKKKNTKDKNRNIKIIEINYLMNFSNKNFHLVGGQHNKG